MSTLYPLKFKSISKETVWGGNRLQALWNKPFPENKKIGESWELSGIQGHLSVVSNGFLKGNNLEELVEIYMGELVGEKTYEQFGVEFPLLIKLIDATETLSVQVHPDDATAIERHNAYGKTEMWYVLNADPGAGVYVGFNRNLSAQELYTQIQNGTFQDTLHFEEVFEGSVFVIPAGRIHAIGKGVVLAEIQQTSDITYRIYDWGRENNPATSRDMHLDMAIDVVDYRYHEQYKTPYKVSKNTPTNITSCPYFTANLLDIDHPIDRDFTRKDSFVIYMCLKDEVTLKYAQGSEKFVKGESMLIPATIEEFTLSPAGNAKLLEVYID